MIANVSGTPIGSGENGLSRALDRERAVNRQARRPERGSWRARRRPGRDRAGCHLPSGEPATRRTPPQHPRGITKITVRALRRSRGGLVRCSNARWRGLAADSRG